MTLTNQNNRIEITLAASAPGVYNRLQSAQTYDMTSASIKVQVPVPGNNGVAREFFLGATIDNTRNNSFYIGVIGGTLQVYTVVNGSKTVVASTAFIPTQHMWLRLLESGGTITAATSADDTTWTTLGTFADPFLIRNLWLEFGAGSASSETITNLIAFDNFNINLNTSTQAIRITSPGSSRIAYMRSVWTMSSAARQTVVTGNRWWSVISSAASTNTPGTNLWYSDDWGITWTKGAQLQTGGDYRPSLSAWFDGSVWHLYTCLATGEFSGGGLSLYSIHTNVASGTPGAIVQTTLDTGGTNLAVYMPSMWITATTTNPRLFILAEKQTSSTTFENRLWSVILTGGTAPDNLGNWSTINDIGALHNGDVGNHFGTGTSWSISGSPRCSIFVEVPTTPGAFGVYTFDPTAATLSLGSQTTMGTLNSTDTFGDQLGTYGAPWSACGLNNLLVFGRLDTTSGKASFYYSNNGTVWNNIVNGTDVTMGHFQITTDGTDFYVVGVSTYVDQTTSASLQYRKITSSTKTLGSPLTFSDTNGSRVEIPVIMPNTRQLLGTYLIGQPSNFEMDVRAVIAFGS